MNNFDELLTILLSKKLLSPADVVESGIQLQHDKRQRFVLSTLLVNKNPRLIVKQTRIANAIESLKQELQAYRIISTTPEANSITPKLLYYRIANRNGLMVMRWCDPNAKVNLQSERDMSQLGTTLGKLHASSQQMSGHSKFREIPWVLSVLTDQPRWRPPELNTILSLTDQAETIRQGLVKAIYKWQRLALIHGDLKSEHCLLLLKKEGVGLCLLDWELATFGDPNWDVASVISDVLFNTLYTEAKFSISFQQHALDGNVQAFLRAYAAWQIVNKHAFLRIALFTAARLFQTALESVAVLGTNETAEIRGLLSMSVQIMRSPERFAIDLESMLEAKSLNKSYSGARH